jgi:hypothetical protein
MKKLLVIVCWFLGLFLAHSQEPIIQTDDDVNTIVDELLMEENFNDLLASLSNFHFLYFYVNYNSATYFSGRDIGIAQFNVSPQITYMNSKGFYASISGLIYSEFIPHWDVTTATIGYGKTFGKNKIFRYFGSVSGYLYSDNNIDGLYYGTTNAGLSIQNKKRTIGTVVSGTYYFGGESTYQIVSRSYVNLKLLKTSNHSLKFRPQLSIITGTQLVDIGGVPLQKEAIIKETLAEPEEEILTSNVYRLIYTQFNFPIQYSYKSFDFELGYNLNIPSAFENESNVKNTGYFNLSLAYLLDL